VGGSHENRFMINAQQSRELCVLERNPAEITVPIKALGFHRKRESKWSGRGVVGRG